MKNILFAFILIGTVSLSAQNDLSDFDKYKQQQEQEFSTYKEDLEKDFQQFVKEQQDWDAMLLGADNEVKTEETTTTVPPKYVDNTTSLASEKKKITEKKEALLKKLNDDKSPNEETPNTVDAVTKKEQSLVRGDTKKISKDQHVESLVEKEENSIPKGNPVGYGYRISSRFGYRIHPIHKRRIFHGGIDIACPKGVEVKTGAQGKVIFAGYNGGYGNYVIIDHGNGYRTAYAHLSKINVKKGDVIKAGISIGEVGSTGKSTGAHLHYEIIKNKKKVNPQAFFS